jgi:hypothetical protein
MARHIILAQSEYTAAALGAWLQLLGEQAPKEGDDAFIVWNERGSSGEQSVLAYKSLVKRIEDAAKLDNGSIALNEVSVLVDAVSPNQLNAILETGGWDHLIAMLILTFPEIKWAFGVISKDCGEFPSKDHDLMSLLTKQRRDPLLDPTKVREWVRQRTSDTKDKDGRKIVTLPCRRQTAAAVDEEEGYAYFHAYTAWRYGFRADVITSWVLMTQMFQKAQKHGYHLLLEDMSLNFPDKDMNLHLSELEKRAEACKALDSGTDSENSWHRILVTTGHDQQDGGVLRRNREYLKSKKPPGRGAVVFKPAGGMLDMWRKAGLFRHLREPSRHGNAKGFVWPPHVEKGAQVPESSHSAPGKLMLVAETLVRRAETFRDSARTVKDFIKGAVLATEAAELLGGRTPTLTLAALALKHEYEVKAECAFVGVGYHFDVKNRCREIAAEVRALAWWFTGSIRRSTELDARVVITNRLAVVFRGAGQFEEEHDCLVAVRRWHRELKGTQISNPLQWITHAVLLYAEFLLASFDRFVWAILLWLVGLTGAWSALGDERLSWVLEKTWSAFFGGNAVGDSWPNLALSCLAVVVGSFHIGVFVSYLYSVISRK